MKAKFFTKETIRDLGTAKRDFPEFCIGDTVKIAQKIKEANKERVQFFEGDVIGFHNNGISSTFTVRKIGSDSVAIEKIFPYYSPNIGSVTIVRRGKIRRAKLYYLRGRVGKAARIPEKIVKKAAKTA